MEKVPEEGKEQKREEGIREPSYVPKESSRKDQA
jgi:hypothetical protein